MNSDPGCPTSSPVEPQTEGDFSTLVARELESAREKFPAIRNMHEGYAVMLEELDEVKAEVWKNQARGDGAALLKELVQLAAMAQRCAEDCGFVAHKDGAA